MITNSNNIANSTEEQTYAGLSRNSGPITLALVFFLMTLGAFSSTLGQETEKVSADKGPIVTASVVSAGGVRITAPGEVAQLQLQAYGVNGEVIFDSGMRPGNVIDWKAADAFGAMGQGPVLVVVTTKDLHDKSSKRFGSLTLEAGQLTLKREVELSPLQKETVKARRQSQKPEDAQNLEPLTIVSETSDPSIVLTTHNGQEGQVTSTNGPLTLATGDALTGQDKPHVRLMPDGRVGIGVQKPEATLDVNGEIRARGGIRFDDGTLLTTARTSVLATNTGKPVATNSDTPTPNASGTGTASRLAKWFDNSGTLSDSVITENANGYVGIGNSNPTTKLSVLASPNAELRFDQGALGMTPVINVISQPGSTTQGGAAGLAAGTGGTSFNFSDNLPFYIVKDTKANVINNNLGNGTPLFTLQPNGNVGIGTTTPTQKLEVAGNLKISGTGNGLMFPDGSVQTTAGGGSGSMTGTAIVSAINDPATAGTINDNRLSPNLARLNTANTFNGNQTVNGDISTTGPTAMVNVAGGVVISCGDRFVQCLNVKNNTLTVQPASQRVGIGVADPQHKLSVAGTVQSTTGGFVFPDGSTQTSAAAQAFTKVESTDLEVAPFVSGRRTIISLDVPLGTYAITASIQFENTANQLFQNNSRQVSCLFLPPTNQNEPGWLVRLGAQGNEADALPLTFTTVLSINGSVHPNVNFLCGAQDGGLDRSYVLVKARRLTAIRLGDLVTQ